MAHSYNSNNDDPDDFMASILRRPSKNEPSKRPPEQRPVKERPISRPSVSNQTQSSPRPVSKPAKKPRTKLKKSVVRTLLLIPIVIALGFATTYLWRGPISSLLEPKSPFTESQQQDMAIPLYYPTKLPGSFKIETNSITQPDNGVLLYAISDDDGKRFNITLQKKPESISLDPLYAALSDVREIDTDHGVVKYGNSNEGIMVANVMMPQTWIIINSAAGTLDDASLTTVVNSLKY